MNPAILPHAGKAAIGAEARLAGLLDKVRLGVFSMSPEGRLEQGNGAFWTMLKGDPHAPDALRHPLLDQVRGRLPELEAELTTEVHAADDVGHFYVVKLARVTIDGRDVIDGIVEDATVLHRAGAEIQRLDAALEEANEALETFGFSVAHDLREPLRTIQGYANALRQDLQAGEQANLTRFVDRIDAIAAHIDQMVSDLLEFARLSRSALASEHLLLAGAVQDARATLGGDPAFQAATIQLAIPDDLRVRAQRPILVQALTKLLGNAVKFVRPNSHASVKVVARPHGNRVRVEVQDNGIGMAAEALTRVFNVFERLHGEEEYPGTGIGLAIVKKGVERMDGAVGVESQPGVGSTFWIELPGA